MVTGVQTCALPIYICSVIKQAMKISTSIIKLRKKYKSYGDNKNIAALASKIAGDVVTDVAVSKCFARKEGRVSVVSAIEKYYTDIANDHEGIKSLSNIELTQ